MTTDRDNALARISNIQDESKRYQQETASFQNELLALREKFDEVESMKEELQTKYNIEKAEVESRIMSLEAERIAVLAEQDSLCIRQQETVQELEDQMVQRDEAEN